MHNCLELMPVSISRSIFPFFAVASAKLVSSINLILASEAAQETGYLKDLPPFIADSEVNYLPRNEVLLICTGSQGEPRSALSRIAADDHPEVTLDAGDTVIFSSREIPGNERSIGRLLNKLASLGIEVVTARDKHVHVSGHPAKDELVLMVPR